MKGATVGCVEPDLVSLVSEIRHHLPAVEAIYLFGSAARGHLRADSDLDVAVLAADKLEADALLELAPRCRRVVGREVDLVDLRAGSLILQAQIVGCGRRLFTGGGSSMADFFENLVLSRHAAFAEERRPLVAEIVKRRSVHAA